MRLTAARPIPLTGTLARAIGWLGRHAVVSGAVAGAFLVMLLATCLATTRGSLFRRVLALDLGEVVPDDIIVDRDVSYVDAEATALKREARARLVPPVFQWNEAATNGTLRVFAAFRGLVQREAQAGTDATAAMKRLEAEGVIGKLDARELGQLLRQSRLPAILDSAGILLQQLLVDGVFAAGEIEALRSDLVTSGSVVVQRGGRGRRELPLAEVLTDADVRARLAERTETLSLEPSERRLVELIVARFTEANCTYDAAETQAARNRAADEVAPVLRTLVKGQVIARRGDLVTEEILQKVRAHGQDTIAFNLNSVLGASLFLLLLCGIAFYRFDPHFLGEALKEKQVLLVAALATGYHVLVTFVSGSRVDLGWLPAAVLVPTATFAMLTTLLVSARFAVVLVLILSLSQLLAERMEVGSFLFALFSGLAGCAAVQGAERRIDLVRAGFVLALISVVVLLSWGLLSNVRAGEIGAVAAGAVNGFASGLLVLGLLPLLEHLLNAPTRFRLLELADLNAPIFRKMLNQATGTYNHSLTVANLAESACDAIGANALLARVGAYYHDIGKIDQPEYFIENQSGANRHDRLRPTLSAAIIKSHVKIGIEKARELGLPEEVIAFIAQHHGKGLIRYFYQRAVEDGGQGESVSPEEFCYPGERPDTKETAVVMLADVVEAATRALRRPTIAKLERVVWQIILDRFHSGELNRSPLQFQELELIKQSFVRVLAGHFHSRIEYPRSKALAQ